MTVLTASPHKSRYRRQIIRLTPDLTDRERETVGLDADDFTPAVITYEHYNN